MPYIFANNAGLVTSVGLDSGVPGIISVTNSDNSKLEQLQAVIITSIGIGQAVNIQFMPSLDQVLYIYAFGDRPGNVSISGIAFDRTCQAKESPGTGILNVLDYYDTSRASVESKIMTVSIGDGKRTLQGFLVKMDSNLADPSIRSFSFTYEIVMVPRG